MPRLPSAADLGEAPAPVPSTAIVPAGDNGAQGAAALNGVGDALQAIDAHLTQVRRASQLTDALGKASQDLGTSAIQYARDQDFKTAPTRFATDAKATVDKYAATLPNDVTTQAVYKQEVSKLVLAKQLNVVTSAAQQEQDYNRGMLDRNLDVYASQIANAGTPLEKDTLLNQVRLSIGEMQQAGWITDVHAAQMTKQFQNKLEYATALRDINSDPQQAQSDLADPAKYQNLDPVKRELLYRSAEVRQRQNDAQAAQADKEDIEQKRLAVVQDLVAGKLTINKVLGSGLPAALQEHYFDVLKAQSKEARERPIRQDPATFLDTLQKIRSGQITDEAQIENVFAQSANRGAGINWEQTNQLRTQFQQARAPDGDKLTSRLKSFVDSVAPQIDHSNPLLGKIDPSGKQNLYEFNYAVQQKVNEVRQAGGDWQPLFDPSSPQYLGKPGAIDSFKKTLQQSAQDVGNTLSRQPAPLDTPSLDAWDKRRDGETYTQWQKRTAGRK